MSFAGFRIAEAARSANRSISVGVAIGVDVLRMSQSFVDRQEMYLACLVGSRRSSVRNLGTFMVFGRHFNLNLSVDTKNVWFDSKAPPGSVTVSISDNFYCLDIKT